MGFNEEEVRRAADLKSWIESRIAELQQEIDRLKEMLLVVDGVLRKASFKAAAELAVGPPTPAPPQPVEVEEFQEVRPLKRAKDGYLLANAYISSSSIAIVPASDVRLDTTTPPFRSFFINRILEGMKAKDVEYVSQGKLKASEMLNYEVEDEGGVIKKIKISNYRDKSRLSEILSTAIWVFTRMLEKQV